MESVSNEMFFSRTACRLCKTEVKTAVALEPLSVISPNVGRVQKVAQTASTDLCRCPKCGFLQIPTIVNPEMQYTNYRYVTGISVGLSQHFKELVDHLAALGEIKSGTSVVEIGSNDGSLLTHAKALGAKVLGIDPAKAIAKAATEAGIPTIGDFFTGAKATQVAAEHGKADLLIANNVVANLDDLDDFFDGVAALLAPKGVFVLETQYALDVIEKFLLDVVYLEHVSYFAIAPLKSYLEGRGMELVDAERIAPKGGSIRFYIQHKNGGRTINANVEKRIAEEKAFGLYTEAAYVTFAKRMEETGAAIRQRLEQARAETGRALVFGSSVGCDALIRYFKLGSLIDAVFDDTPLTNVIRVEENDIPVLTGKQLVNEQPSDVLVLSWRYLENIAAKQGEYIARGGRFYRALPDLAYAEAHADQPLKTMAG
jgi:2-polyprenyl-3-methyl-5-hydroxy-6-metoxy-1,4-benzoquinol methylase